jgi:hypothetical protein
MGTPKWGKHAHMGCVVVFLIVAPMCTTVKRTCVLGCMSIDVIGVHGCAPLLPKFTHECVNVG